MWGHTDLVAGQSIDIHILWLIGSAHSLSKNSFTMTNDRKFKALSSGHYNVGILELKISNLNLLLVPNMDDLKSFHKLKIMSDVAHDS